MHLHTYWKSFSFIRCLEPLVVSLGYSLVFHHFLHICLSSLACQAILSLKGNKRFHLKFHHNFLPNSKFNIAHPMHIGINTQSFENMANRGLTIKQGRTMKNSGLEIFKHKAKNTMSSNLFHVVDNYIHPLLSWWPKEN